MQKAKTTGTDPQDVSDRLLRIGLLTLQLEQARAVLDERIADIRAEHAPYVEDLQAQLAAAERELRLRCEDSRADLLPPRHKSLATMFGRVGWRRQGDKVALRKGVSGEVAAERIVADSRLQVRACVRIRREPDRQRLKALLADGMLQPADLKPFGLRYTEGRDDFYYELDRTEVEQHLEGHHS